jgi:dihydrofolate synthase/folylpolyglutamate synthase
MSTLNEQTGSGFVSYEEAVQWITERAPTFGIKPGLKRMELLMEMLGHPERRLKFIHVGGTNGKGSTCAFLTRALLRSGYDVGTFTSPYLEKFTNRLKYNDQDISEEDMLRLVNEIKPLVDEISTTEWGPPTMFEICTTLAILYFAKVTYPDFVVFEVGLGGRLDCTNIVTPIVSVITNIGHDHMDILGDTIEQIASEKAGIIKAGVPVVSAVEQPEALAVVEAASRTKNTTLYLMNRQFSFEPVSSELDRQVFHFAGPFRRLENISIGMNGYHQMKNAAVALMTLELLRQYYAAIVGDDELYAWPGRLEMISQSPRIVLDGAHNPEGAETLARALRETYRYEKLHMMVGMLSTKNHSGYLTHILPLADSLIITEPDFRKKLDAGALAERVDELLKESAHRPEVVVEPDWKKALERLIGAAGPNDLAVVSGTLYLISDVRSWLLYQSDSEKGW